MSIQVIFVLGYGRRDVVEYLLSAGALIQAHDDGGLHPIHNASSFGHADVVRLLLEAGANPNVRDNWNFTPLHEAALKGKAEVCIGSCVNIAYSSEIVFLVLISRNIFV